VGTMIQTRVRPHQRYLIEEIARGHNRTVRGQLRQGLADLAAAIATGQAIDPPRMPRPGTPSVSISIADHDPAAWDTVTAALRAEMGGDVLLADVLRAVVEWVIEHDAGASVEGV